MNCVFLTFEVYVASYNNREMLSYNFYVDWNAFTTHNTQLTLATLKKPKKSHEPTNQSTRRDFYDWLIEWKQSLLSLLPTPIQFVIIVVDAVATVDAEHILLPNEQIWQSCYRAVDSQLTQQCWLLYGILMVSFFQSLIPFSIYWRSSEMFFFIFLFLGLYSSYFHPAKYSAGIRFSQGFSFYLYK